MQHWIQCTTDTGGGGQWAPMAYNGVCQFDGNNSTDIDVNTSLHGQSFI